MLLGATPKTNKNLKEVPKLFEKKLQLTGSITTLSTDGHYLIQEQFQDPTFTKLALRGLLETFMEIHFRTHGIRTTALGHGETKDGLERQCSKESKPIEQIKDFFCG